MNNKSALGILFVIIGAWLVLKILGITLGPVIGFLFSLLFPFILIGLGLLGLKNGNRLIGGILLVVGALMLLGKLFHLLFPVLAIVLIVWGISMFRRGNNKRFY